MPKTQEHADEGEEIQDELAGLTGSHTVPQVFIKGEFIGGCDGESWSSSFSLSLLPRLSTLENFASLCEMMMTRDCPLSSQLCQGQSLLRCPRCLTWKSLEQLLCIAETMDLNRSGKLKEKLEKAGIHAVF